MAILGSFLWRALGWAMPGLSPAAFYLVAGALAVSLIGSVAYFKGVEGKSAAIEAQRASCELRIANSARISAESLAHVLGVIKAGEDTAPEPKTKAEERALCRKSKLCRENGQ